MSKASRRSGPGSRDHRREAIAAKRADGRRAPILCADCRPPREAGIGAPAKHTSPPNHSEVCECGDRRCACYGFQVRAGIR